MNVAEIIDQIIEKESNLPNAHSIGLMGQLGSGKTYLVKKILARISPKFENQVISPTYNICCIYEADNFLVHHYDLYRIESEEDLYELDIWNSIDNPNILTFIEWIDLFPRLIDFIDFTVSIMVVDAAHREYYFREKL